MVFLFPQENPTTLIDPLRAIDESLREAGNFLKELKKDPNKLHCLQCFVNSTTIVEWIKHEAPQGIE